jgi:hypothetical protein
MTTVQRRIERITILKNQTVMKEVKNEENISYPVCPGVGGEPGGGEPRAGDHVTGFGRYNYSCAW